MTGEATELPFQYNQTRFFEQAGLLSFTKDGRYVIVGGYKGGVCRAFAEGCACFEDYGYRVKLGEGKIAATNWQNNSYHVNWDGNAIRISGKLNLVKQKVSTPIMHLGLRVVSACLGNKIIGMLKNMIILVDKQTDIRFDRQVVIDEESIRITDRVYGAQKVDIECADGFSPRHVASGKFFAITDIGCHSRKRYPGRNEISIERIFRFDSGQIEEKVLG